MAIEIRANSQFNTASGPLRKLYTNNEYSIDDLRYPRDLSSNRRPHIVKFYINLPKQSSYDQLPTTGDRPGQGMTSLQSSLFPKVSEAIVNNVLISPEQKRLKATVSLYMPDTVNMTYTAGYQEDNLSDYQIPYFGQIGSSLLDKLKDVKDTESAINNFLSKEVTDDVLALARTSGLSKLLPFDTLLKGRGAAINPQVQLLFKAVGLRTFQMEFMFSPRSSEESEDVKNIIDTFKFHAAPEVAGTADGGRPSGLFFVVPSTFDIEYLFYDSQNRYLNQIGECVLENVSVDYAPNGFSTFNNGAPVQTRLTLQFKEVDIVDKNRVAQGF